MNATKSTKVFIKSVPRTTATKISEWTDPNTGKKLEKTKIADCKTKIAALYNPKYGGLANGLSYKPWMENGVQVEEDNKKLTLQDREERKWGLEKGFLTNRPWRKGESLRSEDMTYFQRKSWALQDGTTVLDLSNFDDAMCYYMCLDSKYVANSEKEWRDKKWPNCEFYISHANEEEEIKYSRNKRIGDIIAALAKPSMTVEKKRQLVAILGLSSSLNMLSEELSWNTLFSFVTTGNEQNLSKIEELLSLLKDEAGKKEFAARFLLKQALDSRVVFEKGDTYTWNRTQGPIVLGERYADAITFLTNPKKDSFVEELEREINGKLIV